MKKRIIIAAVTIALAAAAGITCTVVKGSGDSFINDNLEALTSGELDPIGLCDSYCRSEYGYICILNTIYGFDIKCDDMVPWN